MTNLASLRTLRRLVGFRTMVLLTVAYALGAARARLRNLHRARPEVETAPEGGE